MSHGSQRRKINDVDDDSRSPETSAHVAAGAVGKVAVPALIVQARARPVVLLVAEAVTLAHFARIATLASALDPDAYEVVVATDPRFHTLAPSLGPQLRPIHSISSRQFFDALASGRPVYDAATLSRYVDDDCALIADVAPDLIVGDFRLSLAVSAPLCRVPYAAVANAYWSPFANVRFPVPDLRFTRMIGLRLTQFIFDRVRPLAFRAHAKPLNEVRRQRGQPVLPDGIAGVYSHGDYTLYADLPDWIPMAPLPARHRHIGPPLWSADTSLPSWWDRLPNERPVVLVAFGTSGRVDLTRTVLSALEGCDASVVVVAASETLPRTLPRNAFATRYVPLRDALGRCSLLICNGGSLTVYQSYASGIPVIGIGTNMDQLLNMAAAERAGGAIGLHATTVRDIDIRAAAESLLHDPIHREAARAMGAKVRAFDAGAQFRRFVAEVLPASGSRSMSEDPRERV